jgi:hypothetical protein
MSDQGVRRWPAVVAIPLARAAEVALALIGLSYIFGSEDPTYKIRLLRFFNIVALTYLLVGFWGDTAVTGPATMTSAGRPGGSN